MRETPLHRPYPYSFYRWGFLHLRYLKCLYPDWLSCLYLLPSFLHLLELTSHMSNWEENHETTNWLIPSVNVIAVCHLFFLIGENHILNNFPLRNIQSDFFHDNKKLSKPACFCCFSTPRRRRGRVPPTTARRGVGELLNRCGHKWRDSDVERTSATRWVPTWRIIPASKWLVTPLYKTNHGHYCNHLLSGMIPPSTSLSGYEMAW